MYDYLIVGAGLFGAIFAHEASKRGKKCLVIDKRKHIAGNIYCKEIEEINVHEYGAHIFHTSNKEVWNYINQFAEFNRYTNSPIAIYKDELYCHILNPKTGYPIKSDLKSITVVSSESIDGDALSTPLFIMGKDKAYELMKKHNISGVMITNNDEIIITKDLLEGFKLFENYKVLAF